MFSKQEKDADLKFSSTSSATGGKSENESKRWRELGNQAFKSGNDRKALQLYNEAIVYAPQCKMNNENSSSEDKVSVM